MHDTQVLVTRIDDLAARLERLERRYTIPSGSLGKTGSDPNGLK